MTEAEGLIVAEEAKREWQSTKFGYNYECQWMGYLLTITVDYHEDHPYGFVIKRDGITLDERYEYEEYFDDVERDVFARLRAIMQEST